MSHERRRAAMKIVLPGLIAGGLCGAAVGFEVVSQPVGVAAAIVVGIVVGLWVLRSKRRFDLAHGAPPPGGDA
jgi:hypothetical protein